MFEIEEGFTMNQGVKRRHQEVFSTIGNPMKVLRYRFRKSIEKTHRNRNRLSFLRGVYERWQTLVATGHVEIRSRSNVVKRSLSQALSLRTGLLAPLPTSHPTLFTF